ncbi:MAG: ShlB/FhaC/HecB family hemolysin secretion/activation protein [Phenylobacterium sp.]
MRFRSFVLACAFACAPALATAQPGGIDQNRADRAPPRAPQTGPALPRQTGRPDVATPQSGATAAPLAAVDVQGSTLPPARIAAVMQPLIGRPLDKATATAAAEALSALYAKSDVALYTIQAPQQDLSGGRLVLQAIEGRVAQVAIFGEVKTRQTPLVQAYAEKLTPERPLRRSTLERQLSLIGDIPGMVATPQLLQGPAPGDVVLGLGLAPRRTDVMLTFINRGTPQLGRYQVQADFSAYGLLRAGDATKFTVSVPTEIERFQYYALTHSQALGTDGLRAQASAGYLRTRPEGVGGSGDAKLASFQLSYPLIRSYEKNLYLTGAVDGLNSSNAQFGRVAASEKVRAVRGAAAYTLSQPKRAILASATASYGSEDLGGAALPGTADDRFRKLNLRGGYDQAIGERFVVRTKAIAQISPDRVPTSELISLGGDDFGRAFTQSTLMGDEGVAGSLELAVRPGFAPAPLAGSEIYGFADKGRVTIAPRFGFARQHADLGSVGLGVRAVWRQKTVLGLEGAYGADAPSAATKRAWRLGVSFRTLR